MKLVIPESMAAKIKQRGTTSTIFERTWGAVTIEHYQLLPADFKYLQELAAKDKSVEGSRLHRRLAQLQKIAPGKKVATLELMAEAITAYIDTLPHGWLFVEDPTSEAMNPYYFEGANYHPAVSREGYRTPAFVTVTASAMRRGTRDQLTKSLRRSEIQGGKSAEDALAALGYMPETEELLAEYAVWSGKYEELARQTGVQCAARGAARVSESSSRWWLDDQLVDMEDAGNRVRVVVDDDEDWGKDHNTCTARTRGGDDEDDDEAGEAAAVVRYPDLPYVRAFDLRRHRFVTTHVANIDRYVYRRGISEKLVIPDSVRGVIDLLVDQSSDTDDIIEGKGKGTIILSSGLPGTGKTLTAEVYAETAKRPLYTVQCAQLGTTPDELEERLATVLHQANRWRAILLIDEAEVYVRTRGADINQNAIVGVFLRLLEYFQGVLFLTTNRELEVDDAILSRCIVHVRYRLPTQPERLAIWRILGEQFKLGLDESLLVGLAEELEDLSGRDIKHLCRLVKIKEPEGIKGRVNRADALRLFKWARQFQDTSRPATPGV